MASMPEPEKSAGNEAEKVIDAEDAPPVAAAEDKPPTGTFGDYLRIFRYADKYDWALNTIALITSVGSGVTLPLMTLVFSGFITKFNDFATGVGTPQQFRDDVDGFVLYFIYLFIGRLALQYVATVSISIAAIRTTRALRLDFLESTLRQEIWHFDKKTIGAAASQVTTNGNRISQGIAEKLSVTIQAISMFLSAFIVALSVQWKLALITMSIIPAILLTTSGCIMYDVKFESAVIRIYSEAATLAQEAISSIRTVHAFWAQQRLIHKYDNYLQEAHKIGNKKSAVYGILFSTEYFFVFSGVALAFWQGFRMYLSGEISSAGQVFNVVFAAQIAAVAMGSLAPQITAFTNAAAAASELFSIIDKKSELDPLSTSGKQPPDCTGHIDIHDLDFAYPSRPGAQVLRGLNMSIPANKTTALVGASGCGKSTLIGLLERWYNPSAGSILLDGIDLADYNVHWLRNQIRLVAQEPVLFRGTVFQNVCKGLVGEQRLLSVDQRMALVKEACIASNAHDFIEDLPEGYHTEIGERASMLSGGQKQRIAIARSIVSDPRILLLDEATSALDPKAERVVQDALNKVSQFRTTLIIAHKLATVKNADNIVVMSNGMLIEQGTHDALIAKGGYYAKLVAAQDLGDQEVNEATDEAQKSTIELEKRQDLQLTRSQTKGGADDTPTYTGTLNYSLLRCIYIMFKEQPELYLCFVIGVFGCFIGGLTFPAQAVLFSRLLDIFQLTGQAAQDRANFFSLMFFVLALANLGAFFLLGITCNVISQVVTHKYRREMFKNVLAQDMDFFDLPENSSGSLTSNLTAYPSSLQELISANILLILIVGVNLVSSSILAIAYGWKLGLVVVFGGLPLLVASGFWRIRMEQVSEARNAKAFAASAGLASEAVTAIRTVASLALEREILAEYAEMLGVIVQRSLRSLLWSIFWYSLSQSIEFLVMALGFWYGSRLLSTGEYSTGQFYVIFIGVIFAGNAAGQFFAFTTSIVKAQGAANYILWLRTLKPVMQESDDNRDIGPDGDGAVALDDIEFRYAQRQAARVLRGISMKIQPGQYAAFVGPSGCGKSTLIALLERFYDPTSGFVSLGEADIADMSPRRYRGHMSLVQQEPTLFQGSVRENVCLGLEVDASNTEVENACRKANALEFVVSLPEGLDTPCGSRGIQFSGGQRQRIAIARAMIREPRLLLLDEATSALDTQSERLVQATLDEAATSRTTIAVAHRLSTVKNADVIFVFEDGRIVETGTHAELQRLRGRYYEMCLAQSLDQAQ